MPFYRYFLFLSDIPVLDNGHVEKSLSETQGGKG